MDTITVIIPTYNRSRLVRRAIESALAQTHAASQIIVVDDGSTDDTAETCRAFGDAIEYIHQSNAGVSAARNQGIRRARHPWTAFLDSDDYWTPTHLESIASVCDATAGEALLYFTDMRWPGGPGQETLWQTTGFQFSGPFLLKQDSTTWVLSEREPISIQSSVFQTAVLKSCGGFNPLYRVSEDRELFCRLGIGGAICAVNTVSCVQTSDDNATNRLGGIVHIRSTAYWEHEHRLWTEVLSRFPKLGNAHRKSILSGLAVAHWRLARLHWRAGHIQKSIKHFFRSAASQPAFLYWLLRHRRSTGWEINIHPPSRAV